MGSSTGRGCKKDGSLPEACAKFGSACLNSCKGLSVVATCTAGDWRGYPIPVPWKGVAFSRNYAEDWKRFTPQPSPKALHGCGSLKT